MKKLIIVRHGAFDQSNLRIADIDHPLNRKGQHQVLEMTRQFLTHPFKPDLLVASPAKRTIETAGIYAKALGISSESIQVEEEIFEAERADILRVVHALDDTLETVILFGHHPGVTKLLHHLVDSDIGKIPLGAFAVLELSAESWQTVSFKHGKLLEYAAPEEKGIRRGWWWRFTLWRRQKIQKMELFVVFLVGLLVILGVIALIVSSTHNSEGIPLQGSMER